MQRPTLVLLLATTLAAPRAGWAQQALTLEQAVTEALQGNRALLAARSSVEEARAGVTEARSTLFPRVTVSESWQRGNQPVFVFSSLLSARRFAADNFAIDALNHPDPTGFFRTTVGVEQVLFDGGQRGAARRAAAAARDAAEHGAHQAALDTRVAVAEAYGRLLTAQAARRAAEAGLAAAREDLARAEGRRDQGMLTDADVLDLSVHVSDLEQRVIGARGDEAVARADLNRLLGAPIDRDVAVVEPTPASRPVPELNALLEAARASRPALQQAEAGARIAEAAAGGARGALWPQVAAQAALDVSGTSINDRASSWLVGGELRWTFGVAGGERARVRRAAEAASRARVELEETRARVEVDVVSALRQLEAARARHAVGQASVAQATESQRIIRDRFEAGLAGTDQVLRASATLLAAEARRVGSLVDAIVATAQLDRAVGRLP